jgi:polar amino acid transport system substrate-binding protein
VFNGSLRRGVVAAVTLVLAGGLSLSACGDDEGTAQSESGVKLVESGKIKTCTSLPYPPFQFAQGGKTVGFDVDMIDLAAKKLGVTQEIVDVKFDIIKSGAALNSGRCDVAAAGMTITEDRKANLDFTRPYFPEVLALMTKKGETAKTLAEVKSKKLGIGVQTGTTSLDKAKEAGLAAKEYDDAGKQLLALQSGQIDVILQDLPTVNDWMKKSDVSGKYQISAQLPTGLSYGFAVRKGYNPELLKTLNDTITASVNDGTWKQMYVKWIGSEPVATPAAQ